MLIPGILYVTMQPLPGLPLAQFHEWYNNEHGPTRLRLPGIFSSGLRYRAADDQSPEFLAVYDVTDMSHLETDTYTALRANRSPREAQTIGQVDVQRYFYDLVDERTAQGQFKALERLTKAEARGHGIVAMEIVPTNIDDPNVGLELSRWFANELVEQLSKSTRWVRSRLFKTSRLETGSQISKYLLLHDYANFNGEDMTSLDSLMPHQYIASARNRAYALFYIFGPAPRDLQSLSELSPEASFISPDGKTAMNAGSDPVIASYITTRRDSLVIPYILEGNPSPTAPCVAFSNSLLTSLHMWDGLIAILKQQRPDLRFLRYDTRGRNAIPHPPVPATVEMVTSDIEILLDALRIRTLHALIGVSMGGVTTLNFVLTHPSRLGRFIACDFNCVSSPANTQAWKDRIAMAQGDASGMSKLADRTVARWFHPDTLQNNAAAVQTMAAMVQRNGVEGFKNSCTVLWDYDLRPRMKGCKIPGLLVVGSHDGNGAIVTAMDGFKDLIGANGVELRIVPETGHLPMFENPAGFWEVIKDFVS